MTDPKPQIPHGGDDKVVRHPSAAATPRKSLHQRLEDAKQQWSLIQQNKLDIAAMFVGMPILATFAASVSIPTTLIIIVMVGLTFPVWWIRTRDWRTAGQSAFIVAAGSSCLTYSWWGSETVWPAVIIGLAMHCLGSYLSYENSLGE